MGEISENRINPFTGGTNLPDSIGTWGTSIPPRENNALKREDAWHTTVRAPEGEEKKAPRVH